MTLMVICYQAVVLSNSFDTKYITSYRGVDYGRSSYPERSLELYRQEGLESRFRERLHSRETRRQELDKWLDRLEEVMDKNDKPPSLWDITEGIRKQREGLMGTAGREWIESKYSSYLLS